MVNCRREDTGNKLKQPANKKPLTYICVVSMASLLSQLAKVTDLLLWQKKKCSLKKKEKNKKKERKEKMIASQLLNTINT